MPYASTTGAPKTASRSSCTCGGKRRRGRADEAQRRGAAAVGTTAARASTTWWIVGTAVYQVGAELSSQAAELRRVEARRADARLRPLRSSVESSAPTRPCTWKSGMTFRQRSSAPSSRSRAIFARRHGRVRVRQRHELRPRCRAATCAVGGRRASRRQLGASGRHARPTSVKAPAPVRRVRLELEQPDQTRRSARTRS